MRFIILFLSFFVLTGCSLPKSPPSDYYVLPAKDTVAQIHKQDDIRIGILPVAMPSYLQRPQMVLRNPGEAQVSIEEFHRWAEDLPTAFQRVLAITLSDNLPNTLIMPLRMGFIADYRLAVDVRSFEGNLNASATLDAFWTLQKDSQPLIEGHFLQSLPTGESFSNLVEVQSNLILLLSENIALTLKQAGIKDFQ